MVVSDDMDEIHDCRLLQPHSRRDVIGYVDDKHKLICTAGCTLPFASYRVRATASSPPTGKAIILFLFPLTLSGIDQIGIVSKITKVISDDQNVNMRSIHS